MNETREAGGGTTVSVSMPTTENAIANEIIVSADSHVMEPTDLWTNNLPAGFKGRYPEFPPRNAVGEKPGGWDPKARVREMAVDGVSAEVLYPTLGLRLFALEDAETRRPASRSPTTGSSSTARSIPTSWWACR